MKKWWFIIPIAVLFAVYYPIWVWMYGRWMAPTSYYSHGFLIPLMSGYLVYKNRKGIVLNPEKGKTIGLFIVFFGLFLLLISSFWQIYFGGAWSFLFVVAGGMVYLYGFQVLIYLWFPIVFLVFMIPIPLITVADISLQLKLFAAAVAIRIIDFVGVTAIREGSYIHLKTGTMIVGDICSGLRSLIALLAFGAFFSYLTNLTRLKKVLLFIASIPIAWVANICRIVVLTLIANSFGIKAASGFTHDASGILIFIVAFILLFTIERILRLSIFGKNKK